MQTAIDANAIFVVVLFLSAILLVVTTIEVGYRIGLAAHRGSRADKEKSISVVASTMLGLLAFMLAFTFGIAANRFDTRNQLVRDEANAIRTAWARSDFLPKADQDETKILLHEYLRARIALASQSANSEGVQSIVTEAEQIQRRLWDIALPNVRKDLDSDIGALYIESLNEISALHASRVAVGLQLRIPTPVWLTLAGITSLAMVAMGYQFGVASATRTIAVPLMALAFALVIGLIGLLDRPIGGLTAVPQRPLENLLSSIE